VSVGSVVGSVWARYFSFDETTGFFPDRFRFLVFFFVGCRFYNRDTIPLYRCGESAFGDDRCFSVGCRGSLLFHSIEASRSLLLEVFFCEKESLDFSLPAEEEIQRE